MADLNITFSVSMDSGVYDLEKKRSLNIHNISKASKNKWYEGACKEI